MQGEQESVAAHLAGALASHTTLPVIGVPIKSGALEGVDALYSTVQMPPGVPVATVGIDGAKNGAYLACEILSIKYPEIAKKLEDFRRKTRKSLDEKSKVLKGRKP
jgi:5-(carboxyamino)imidazole ribonucleotide mutase